MHSADYPSLQAIVKEFLDKVKKPVDRACFAVAGPVIGGRVKTTNLPWVIEDQSLAQGLNLNAQVCSSDQRSGGDCPRSSHPAAADVVTINAGEPVPRGAIGVIAPGTGLGESLPDLGWIRAILRTAPKVVTQILRQPMKGRSGCWNTCFKRFEHVSFEHVCSGIGIPNIYRYLRDVEQLPEDPAIAKLISAASDPSPVIINQGTDAKGPSRACRETIDMFVSILGSEAGNLAVKVLATGGVYVAGGVAIHMLGALQQPSFLQHFRRKGRFAELLGRIPIHVIVTPAGLAGAAAYGLENSMSPAGVH